VEPAYDTVYSKTPNGGLRFLLPNFGERMLQIVQATPSIEAVPFEDFWTLYPRRLAKKDAVKAWTRMSHKARVDALTALVDWRRVWLARGEIEFIPHPATWLNGERWEDELPTNNTPTHASHVPAKPHLESERGEMPASVRDAIARIRGKAA
jgi:hypothetical protein